METYDKQYIKNCILNKKVIPPIIRKEIYIEILKVLQIEMKILYVLL